MPAEWINKILVFARVFSQKRCGNTLFLMRYWQKNLCFSEKMHNFSCYVNHYFL